MILFSVTPMADPLDLRCAVVLRCAHGWDYAKWHPLKSMPCRIASIDLQEDPKEGTSVMLVVDFPDLPTRDLYRTSTSGADSPETEAKP
jgi:hypothetical protein